MGAIILHKACFVIRGDIQLSYRDFDPENLYASVAQKDTIRIFLAKCAAQNFILETADSFKRVSMYL